MHSTRPWPPEDARWPYGAPRDETERYHLVYGVARRAALKLLGDAALAEDLAQETWLDVERFLARYVESTDGADVRDFAGWVVRVSTNKAIKVYRSRWRRVLRERPDEEEAGRGLEPSSTSPAHRPDELAVLRQHGARVRAALDTLSPAHAEALRMIGQGYTHREIAEALDAPVGTIKVRVHRARRELAARLRADADSGELAAASGRSS